MKKAIILLALTMSLMSCSKDDSSTKDTNLSLTYPNLAGKWYFKETIKADGTIVPYTSACIANPDHIEFFEYGFVNEYIRNNMCALYSSGADSELYYNNETKRLWSAGSEIPDSKVIKFTQHELQLQYQHVLAPGFETRVLVYTRN